MNEYRISDEREMKEINPIRNESLSNLMHSTCEKAHIALKMAYQIDCHLFGKGVASDVENGSPSCFMEELAITDNALGTLCAELESIMKRLGV